MTDELDPQALRRQIADDRQTWFKVLGMLEQNRAVVEPQGAAGVRVRFCDDHGQVFDVLDFDDVAAAEADLAYNGFTRLADSPSFTAIGGRPARPLTESPRWRRPVYSSGEYWRPAPPGFVPGFVGMPGARDDDLQRFVDAQDPVWYDVIEELLDGRKTGHWMWFVFPQLRSLGRSAKATRYGLRDLAEAQAYWRHDLLRDRLLLAMDLVLRQPEVPIERLLGAVDAMKLRSCATLFQHVAPDAAQPQAVLDRFFGGEVCPLTQAALR